MRPDLAVLSPRFLRTKEAADFLSLSARTLEKHRAEGGCLPRLKYLLET